MDKRTDPSPDEIRQRTAEIRATWDERTHHIRSGQDPETISRWTPPQFTEAAIFLAIEKKVCLEESVGESGLREGAEVVIERGFIGFLGAETV